MSKYYGVIDETELSLRYPRMIDGDECESLQGAWAEAFDILMGGASKVSIGPLKYYGEDGNGFWGEDTEHPNRIEIDAEDIPWLQDMIDGEMEDDHDLA